MQRSSSRTPDSFFTDRDAFRTVDLHRLIYVAIAIGAFVLTEVGRSVYRPFIYERAINDFGIADSMGNLGGIVVQVYASLAILNSRGSKAFNVVGFLVTGYIFYEVLQPYLPRGVFDWKDVFGTIIGGIVAVLVLLVVRGAIRRNPVFFEF